MLEVEGKLVSLDIIEKQFVCHLEKCKGACCIEGESGAPLEPEEVEWLVSHGDLILPRLDKEAQNIYHQTPVLKTEDSGSYSTPLKENGACIYSNRDENGILHCTLEQTYQTGASDFIKPISCHLYPIRINKSPDQNWEALNYDRWDICSPACTLGATLGVPVYQFLQKALERKYGAGFYSELDAIAQEWIKTTQNS